MSALLVGAALLSGCLLAAPLMAQDRAASSDLPIVRPSPPPSPEQTVSADLLRHPISSKTRRMLQRAVELMRSGKDREAIHQLEGTLSKDPSSAPYVRSLLGFEYMKTDQFAESVNSFQQAVMLLPHDAINHHNLGISLAAIGDYKHAEEQLRLAQELAPGNPQIRRVLDALLAHEHSAQAVIVAGAP